MRRPPKVGAVMTRMDQVFKAYDIRGTVPDQLNADMCRAIGRAVARFAGATEILIVRDMRASGVELSGAFSDGVRSEGVAVTDLGLGSTDFLYFAAGHLNAPGAMFTASHNPAQYNGIKLCLSGARPIGVDTGLLDIETMAEELLDEPAGPPTAAWRSLNLLPQWASDSEASQTRKFFEVKSNMTRDELVLLKQAGIALIQPGIESLADRTLRIMGKGVTAAQNIALLRWCMEIGIEAHWNLIYGFPGEDPAGFGATTELIQKLSHLSPPQGCFPIRVDRFSPNYERWQQHGFRSIAPVRAYSHVFAAAPEDIAQLAYFFDYEHAQSAALPELAAPMRAFWDLWLQHHSTGRGGEFAVVETGADGCTVSDTRFNRRAECWQLTLPETSVLLACDLPVGPRRLTPHQKETLESLLRREIVLECGDKLIAAPLIPQSIREQFRYVPNALSDENRCSLLQR